MIGIASLTFVTRKKLEIKSCKANPSEGQALLTVFQVSCEHSPGDYTFEIHSVNKNDEGERFIDTIFSFIFQDSNLVPRVWQCHCHDGIIGE